uniref:Uncharacterized protein n=1 Tax=Arundo donax TaxID=35708 RepID=A0A0A9D116_ARUDO
MRGGGGGSGLGFRGVAEEEEEEEVVVSAPERPMRRRRRWGAEADDCYSPSSTGGGGSSCCGSFGCDSVGPGPSLLSTIPFRMLSSRIVIGYSPFSWYQNDALSAMRKKKFTNFELAFTFGKEKIEF